MFANNTNDWIYIILVIVAFFLFLGWNRKRQHNQRNRTKRNFKDRINDRKKSQSED